MRSLFVKYIILTLLVVLLGACGKVPVTGEGLSHKQANRIVSVLSTKGITATVEKSGRKDSDGYKVLVKSGKYLEAVQILDENGLPEDEDRSLEYLTLQSGFLAVNSKEVEALRADRALAVQLEELFENNIGVISAKVIVKQLSAASHSPSVTATLRVRNKNDISQDDIRSIVHLVVPNIPDDQVKVILTVAKDKSVVLNGVEVKNSEILQVPLVSLLNWQVSESDQASLVLFYIISVASCGLICFAMGFALSSVKNNIKKPTNSDELFDLGESAIMQGGKE